MASPCPKCPHPPHLGLCQRRNGGTAYDCACIYSSDSTRDWRELERVVRSAAMFRKITPTLSLKDALREARALENRLRPYRTKSDERARSVARLGVWIARRRP